MRKYQNAIEGTAHKRETQGKCFDLFQLTLFISLTLVRAWLEL